MSGSTSPANDSIDRRSVSWSWRPSEIPTELRPDQVQALAGAKVSLSELVEFLGNTKKPGECFEVAFRGTSGQPPEPPAKLEVFHLGELGSDTINWLDHAARTLNEVVQGIEAALSPSLRKAPHEVWSPGEASSAHLGTTVQALAQVRAASATGMGATGKGVVVVIADQGVNEAVLRQRRYPASVDFAGGWRVKEDGQPWKDPGTWPDGHGTKMAELVLSVAPDATILDLPLVPPRIHDLRAYIEWAAAVYGAMPTTIGWAALQNPATYNRPWVFCNAWSVYDLSDDFPEGSPWNYGQNPRSVLSKCVATLPNTGLADVVFAAGNNGQFAPDPRSAPQQTGPGRSIYGVAALPQVLTVGAVRNDEIWLGYSAQGPAPTQFRANKPDLVAPSQFTPPFDADRGYGGTSATCALATGAVAAVRSLFPIPNPSASFLLNRFVRRARPLLDPTATSSCVGAGILDLQRVLVEDDGTPFQY